MHRLAEPVGWLMEVNSLTTTSINCRIQHVTQAVLEEVSRAMARDHFVFDFADFHGFKKSALPAQIVDPIRQRFGFSERELQIEVAGVLTDLTHEIHSHRRSQAHVTCIGENFGLPDPRDGYIFLGQRWFPMKLGDSFDIPTSVEHGFTVDEGGLLYFLSVQSPPLVSEDGQEDYVAQPFTRWSRGPHQLYES